MNVEEALRRLNGYLQRRGKVDGSGGWTEQWLLDILTDANQDMYHRIIQYGPEIFQRASTFTYPSGSESVVLKDFLGATPAALWYVGTLANNAAVSATNMPMPIQMERRTNIDNTQLSSNVGSAWLASMNLVGAGAVFGQYSGHFLGKDFILRPLPQRDVFMFVRWTPAELPALTDPQDELLFGELPQFHQGVVYRAAICAKAAKGEDTSQLEKMYIELAGPYDANLKMGARSRQRQQPSQREPMRWEY
jgi:hypothetical protein